MFSPNVMLKCLMCAIQEQLSYSASDKHFNYVLKHNVIASGSVAIQIFFRLLRRFTPRNDIKIELPTL